MTIMPAWHRWALIAAIGVVAALAVVSLSVGVTTLSPLAIATGRDGHGLAIVLAIRLPRTIALILAGSSMAVAGSLMQTLSRSRFVEPGTSGAIEAAVLGLLLTGIATPGLPILGRMIVATFLALAETALFLAIIDRVPRRSPVLVPLVGLILGSIVRAAATFVAYRFGVVQSLVAWTTGDFSSVLRGRYEILWVALFACLAIQAVADRFTVAGLGDGFAENLGLDRRLTTALGLAAVSLATAAVVTVAGAVPFVGLVVPNVVRFVTGDNVRRSVPLNAATGACFVLACDVLGRTIIRPFEVPVGPILGMIGGAAFLVLLRTRRALA